MAPTEACATWLENQQALSVVHELRGKGLDADIDLPRICVVGKQSSGKSSVMEALTGIAVPRAAGTCTRCAFEISTSHAAGPFRCAVSIRCELEETKGTVKIPLDSTSDASGVPELLAIAQEVVLNKPFLQKHYKGLMSGGASLAKLRNGLPECEEGALLFSRDVVVVELRGEAFSDLELIDLPGLIQSVEKDGEESLISLIQDLCSDYLEKPNTLIAMCCPFNDDMENQAVRMLARRHDPDGQRTVGVLTKADLLQKGSDVEWLPILQNKKFELRHGYFAVRNPPQAELDDSIVQEDARKKEDAFFREDPMGQLLHGAVGERCGVPVLRAFFSAQLCKLICSQLPGLRKALQGKLRLAQAEQEGMAERVHPANARRRLVSLVEETVRKFASHVEAEGAGPFPFWTRVRAHYELLYQACFRARPSFLAGGSELDPWDLLGLRREVLVSLAGWGDWARLSAALDATQAVTADVSIDQQKLSKGCRPLGPAWTEMPAVAGGSRDACFTRVVPAQPALPAQPAELPAGWQGGWLQSRHVDDGAGNKVSVWKTYNWRPAALVGRDHAVEWPVTLSFQRATEDAGEQLTISSVSARIEAIRGRELALPGGPAAYRAAQQVVAQALGRWREPTLACVEGVAEELQGLVVKVVAEVAGAFPKLERKVATLLQASVDGLKAETVARALELLLRQEGAPDLYTQSGGYLKSCFDQAQQELRQSLGCTLRTDRLTQQEQAQLDQLLAKAGHTASQLACPSRHDDAIWCMAAAYAYYKVAFKRFADHLPRATDELLLRGFSRGCWEVLMTGLDVMNGDNEELCQWFEEDAAMGQRRRELQTRLQRQREGLKLLDRVLASAA